MCRTSSLLVASLLLAIAIHPSLFAAKKESKRGGDPAAALQKKLASSDLPADAKASAKKVIEEHAQKLKDAQAKVAGVLTEEQKAAQKTARKEAKTAGKKRKEAKADLEAALKLSAEQKTKLADAHKELASAQKDLQKGLQGVLTAEQLAKVGLKTKKKKNA